MLCTPELIPGAPCGAALCKYKAGASAILCSKWHNGMPECHCFAFYCYFYASMKRALFIISVSSLLLAAQYSRAQEVFFSAGRNILTNTKYTTDLVNGSRGCNSFDAALVWKTSDTQASEMYGNPRIGVGVSYTNLGAIDCVEGSSLGDSFTLYGTFMRDFLSLGPVRSGYSIQFGGAYMTHPYHKTDNPLNVLYGGPFTFHIKGGLYLLADITPRWSIGAEVAFKHNSACRLIIPNRGINAICYSFTSSYSFGGKTVKPGLRIKDDSPLNRKIRFALFASGGIHKCMAEWEADQLLSPQERPDYYTPWFKGSIGAEAIWRYCARTSSGLQLELHYLGNMEALRRSDAAMYGERAKDAEYSPLSPGIGFVQDLYFGSWALGGGFGVYLYRKVGIHENRGPFYQKVHLRYYPPFLPSCFAGIALRAHKFNRADYLEFTLGAIL